MSVVPKSYFERDRRRVKEGLGQGRGPNYRPWLTNRSGPTDTNVTRLDSFMAKRELHVFGSLEPKVAIYFDTVDVHSPHVQIIEILEQFPLLPPENAQVDPTAATRAIAQELGILHPPRDRPEDTLVMTTDLVVCLIRHGLREVLAIDMKSSGEDGLENGRTCQKLDIARVYWQRYGFGGLETEYRLATERDIPDVLVENMRQLGRFRDPRRYSPPSKQDLNEIRAALKKEWRADVPLSRVANTVNRRLGLPSRCALDVVYHLIATRCWEVDFYKPIGDNSPLNILNFEGRRMDDTDDAAD
jgi:TnsA endonuclease N terminal/TnsA endonuclease C terminal